MLKKLVERVSAKLPVYLEGGNYKGDLLASGDRLAAAQAQWPEQRFPTLYRDIPDDIRRPVVWDGRILGGHDVGHFLWSRLTPATIVEAAQRAGNRAIWLAAFFALFVTALYPGFAPTMAAIYYGAINVPLAIVAVVAGLVAAFYVAGRAGLASVVLVAALLIPLAFVAGNGALAIMDRSNFGAGEYLEYPAWAAEIGAFAPVAGYYAAKALLIVSNAAGFILAFLLTFGAAFLAAWIFGFNRSLKAWAAETGAPLAMATRDALLVYKAKGDGAREAEYRAYCRQVEDATTRLAKLPLIPVGKALGTLRARGDMKAPMKGQLMAFDGESIRNHTLVLGDTGTGKTRDVLKPLFDRIIGAKWGSDHRLGAYVTDGKGTLWRDLEPMARAHGRDDIRIIGTAAGQFGADLLAGMSPLEVATTFKAVAGIVAGSSDDGFWTESASLLVMHVAALASVMEMDPSTMETWERLTLRPYSLSGIARLAVNENAQQAATNRLVELEQGYKEKAKARAEADGEPVRPWNDHHAAILGVVASVAWLVGTFETMAKETKSGIVANVNSTLGKLAGAGELANRFASGTYADLIDVDYALEGGIVLVAIGETEYGVAGRVIASWLKQRLFVLAKRRLVADPDACAKTSVAFMGDEYQMLVTTGPDSDTTFWNVARETGVFYVGATQSVAALKQAIGDEQTANLLNLFRNKIVLSTGEVETIDYIIKLTGTLPLGFESERHFFATQTSREAEYPVRTALVKAHGLSAFLPSFLSLDTPSMSAPAHVDRRFLGGQNFAAEAANAAAQAAFWRSEDKSREALVSGLNWSPKLRHDELRQGQGLAFAMLYRGGVDRADILDLRSA